MSDIEERIRTGFVNPGWSAIGWTRHLRYMADACQDLHPDHAARLRRWADAVERMHRTPEAVPVPVPHWPPEETPRPEIVRY